jgi:hypothetical protein
VRETNHSAMHGVVYAMHVDPGNRRISGQVTVGSSGNTIVFPTAVVSHVLLLMPRSLVL